MPIFEYKCQSCHKAFEKKVPFTYDKLPACPNCKSKKTLKLLSSPGIVFKGSGFYKTDNQSKCNTREKKDSCDKK